jgi:hypothetical protein
MAREHGFDAAQGRAGACVGATVPQRLQGLDNVLDVDRVDVHRPQALGVIEQRPFPRLKRARAPAHLVALDHRAGDLGERLAGFGGGDRVTTLGERIAALSDGFAQLLRLGAGVGEGDGVG